MGSSTRTPVSREATSQFESPIERSLFVAEVSRRLASSLDYTVTIVSVARAAVPALADWSAVDILDEDGSIERLEVAHVDRAREEVARELARRYPPNPTALNGVPRVLRTGRSELLSDVGEALLDSSPPTPEHGVLIDKLGLVSGMIVPLVARERTLGALWLARLETSGPYAESDLQLAEDFAARCALAIDNARLYLRAREGIELRDTFLATVSHDLKNPLAAIAGQAQYLRRLVAREDSPLAARLTQGLERIDTTVARMNRMIDELLDVARLELGSPLTLERSRLDLVELTRRIVAEHQQRADHHLIQLAAEPELVGEWDLARLERVLDNLVGNAVKYSPDGGVITVVVVREDDETGSWAILSVRDQGVGIPESDLAHIFERFHRAQNVGTISGTGIGLAVIRDIVHKHGGSITVDSREGHGSTFTVRLPLCATSPGP